MNRPKVGCAALVKSDHMLENLEYLVLLWYNITKDKINLRYMKVKSNNVSSGPRKVEAPDNQQERLKTIGWIVGFVDGEGSFSVSIYRNRKARMKLGWQVFPEFVVTQGEKSLNTLKIIQKMFSCGKIYKASYREKDNHREPLYRYCVRSVQDLLEIIIPFFQENKLQSAKRKEFEKFVRILRIIKRKKHLSKDGLKMIALISQTMNQCKRSQFLESSETIRRTH